jgi:phage shock protein C
MNKEIKRLHRSQKNKIFAGIFGGLGDYFNIDPVILRMIAILVGVMTGIFPFIFIYIIFAFVVPKEGGDLIENESSTLKKWWFWFFLFLFLSLPLVIILITGMLYIRNDFDRITTNIYQEVSFVEDKEEVINYLENNIIEDNFNGEIFADYYTIGQEGRNFFVWAHVSEYYKEEEALLQGAAQSTPLVVVLSLESKVIAHNTPSMGSLYRESVENMFPEEYWNVVLNFELERAEELEKMEENVKEKARIYFAEGEEN